MKLVTGITSDPKQQMTLVLDDGSQVYLYIEYNQQQLGWFMNLAWSGSDWTLDTRRITASPNLLRQWQNVIPFGIAVITQGNVEPLNLTDFVDGTATVYLLTAQDVLNIEANTFGGL